jgi:anti-anti-sigma regulatory factor
MAAGLILLSVTAWLFVTGQVVVPLNVQANSAQGSAWASGLVTFLLLNGIVVLSLSYLISQLEQSLSLAFASAEAATEAASKADAQAQASVAQAERLAQVERDLRELVATLELPTIPIADRMLLAPLVGPVDLPRAQALQGRLLSQVVARGADTVVIDLSGARTADSSVADGLIQLVESLRLVGSTAVFTGLTPEMALEITGHIRDQRAFVTARSPQDALEQARRESPLP